MGPWEKSVRSTFLWKVYDEVMEIFRAMRGQNHRRKTREVNEFLNEVKNQPKEKCEVNEFLSLIKVSTLFGGVKKSEKG